MAAQDWADRAVERFDNMLRLVMHDRYTRAGAAVRRSGMARSTGHRWLADLEALDMLSWDESGAAILGDAALGIGLHASGHGWLKLRALPLLQELRAGIGETVCIGFQRTGGAVIELGPTLTAFRQELIGGAATLEIISSRPALDAAAARSLALREPLPRLLQVRRRDGGDADRAPAPASGTIQMIANELVPPPASNAARAAQAPPMLLALPRDMATSASVAAALNRLAHRQF